jgi:hypothetical protein
MMATVPTQTVITSQVGATLKRLRAVQRKVDGLGALSLCPVSSSTNI